MVHTKEPDAKLTSHGMILGQNPHYVGNVETEDEKKALIDKYGSDALRPAVKMSKSLGNVVNPDDIVKQYGADTLRMYIMFIGDFTQAATWSDSAVAGCKRFLDRIWNLASVKREGDAVSAAHEKELHRTIQKVSQDIEELKFNTAIAQMMTLVNNFYRTEPSRGDIKILLQLLSPFAPHIAEELWEVQGFEGLACESKWPSFDESKMADTEKTIAVQVNGKLRSTVTVPANCDNDTVIKAALADRKIAGYAEGMDIVKTIVVPNKLVNLILKPKK